MSGVQVFRHAHHVVVEVAHVGVEVGGQHLLVASQQHVQHLAHGRDGAAKQDHVATRRESLFEARARPGVRAVDQALFERLEAVLDLVDRHEVAVDHVVQQRVAKETAGKVRTCSPAWSSRSRSVASVVALPVADGDGEVARDVRRDLAQVDALFGHRDDVGDQGEEPLVLLDLGPLAGVHRVLDGQRMEAEVGLQRGHRVFGGVGEIDPDEGRGFAAGAGRLLERQRLGDAPPASVHGDGRLHDRDSSPQSQPTPAREREGAIYCAAGAGRGAAW